MPAARAQAPVRERSLAVAPPSAHPADSSRILLSLLTLVRQADETRSPATDGTYQGLIRPAVLRTLLSALHYRDQATVYHSRRVALTCVGIARELGWEEQELRVLEIAAMLHDVGKIGVPDSILRKPAELSPDEAELVAQNQNVGMTVLQACQVHNSVVTMIGQAARTSVAPPPGEAPLKTDPQQGARILAVADMYDSLVHDQAYRAHLSHSEAVTALLESERRLDRNVIAGLRRWLAEGGQALLADDRQAVQSIRASAPIDAATVCDASTLCHAFAYLYILESLYDGYYVVDADLRLVICSNGMHRAFPAGRFTPGETWSRRMIGALDGMGRPLPDSAYPVHKALETGRPHCATLRLAGESGQRREIEFHAVPVQDLHGRLHGVAEIIRDLAHSKKNPALYLELREAATQDPLTGAANRGELETRLAELYADYQQGGCSEPFSVIFVDLDHFKRVNDTYDHSAGDEVLVNLVRLLNDELYSGETLGRYGGEEFLILCPATPLEQAVQRADRIRRAVQDARLLTNPHVQVTASMGVAQVCPDDTPESVLQRADQALFDAKRCGRNRACFRQPGETPDDAPPTSLQTELVHTVRLVACQEEDILIAKLKGFVQDHQARLLDVQPNLITMRLGDSTIFGGWGKNSRKQPVQIVVAFGEEEVSKRSAATRHVTLEVTVRPVGRVPNAPTFQARASRTVELLRSYLLAD